MKGKRLLHSIELGGLLSYGEAVRLDLEPLNVLIGPNASGKSNLIEALSILAAAPRDVRDPIRKGGGVLEWLWKGDADPIAYLQTTVAIGDEKLQYYLAFSAEESRFSLDAESLRRSADPAQAIFVVGGSSEKPIRKGEVFLDEAFQKDASILAQ